jgi:phosphomannomutase/phosphoglucomutase
MKKFTEIVDLPNASITTIDGIRADYDKGWGLVRASNTTPSLVIRFEADNESTIDEIKHDFRQQMTKVQADIQLPF